MQILSSATGLLIVPCVRSTYKLLLTVFTMKWLSVSKYTRQTTKRHHTSYAFPFKCLKDWKSNSLYKTCQMELPGEQVQKNLENWWTRSYHLFEARSLTRQKCLWYPSCPSFLLPQTEWTRLPLEGLPWKFILKSFVKICRESRNLMAVGQNYREIAIKAPSCSAMISGY